MRDTQQRETCICYKQITQKSDHSKRKRIIPSSLTEKYFFIYFFIFKCFVMGFHNTLSGFHIFGGLILLVRKKGFD